MCDTCGCSQPADAVTFKKPGEDHQHHHGHDHPHDHHHNHDHIQDRIINIERDVLAKNNSVAERNRGYFDAKNILQGPITRILLPERISMGTHSCWLDESRLHGERQA